MKLYLKKKKFNVGSAPTQRNYRKNEMNGLEYLILCVLRGCDSKLQLANLCEKIRLYITSVFIVECVFYFYNCGVSSGSQLYTMISCKPVFFFGYLQQNVQQTLGISDMTYFDVNSFDAF